MSQLRLKIAILFCILSLGILYSDFKGFIPLTMSNIAINSIFLMLGFVLTEFINFLEIYGAFIRVVFQSLNKEKIRISFAYLIRIKHKDQYLLVKSHRIPNQLQPAGGVFEFYDSEILKKFELYADEGFSNSPKRDLRKMMKCPRRNLAPFLIWFKSQKGRELSPQREFHEELIEENILKLDNFKTPSFKFVGSYLDGISFSEHFQVSELKLFDIFELEANDDQQLEIEGLFKNGHASIEFLSEDIIKKNGYDKSTNKNVLVGGQTKFIL